MILGFSPGVLVALIVSILIAMSVHESAHAYVAFRLGDKLAADQGRISLNPLRHIDPITTVALPVVTLILFHLPILAARPVPFNPERVRFGEFGSALVAFSGPVSNLGMAILVAAGLHMVALGSLFSQAMAIFIILNVALFVFNLVPIPPLDGSRILYAFAPEPIQNFMNQIEPYGLLIIFGLVLVGGLGGILVNVNSFVLSLLL